MVTMSTGDFTHIKAISHNTGKTHAITAIVFLLCALLKKSIHPSCPNKSEKIRVRAANAENIVEKRTIKDPKRKNPLAQLP